MTPAGRGRDPAKGQRVAGNAHLKFGRSALVADEEQVGLAVDGDLLLEAAALGRLFLHVRAGQVAVDQRRLAGRRRADDAQTQVGHRPRQRPFLAVDERVCPSTVKRQPINQSSNSPHEIRLHPLPFPL